MEEEVQEQIRQLKKTLEEIVSEEAIRRIVREEMDAWWDRRMGWLRAQTGLHDYEVK